MVGFAGIPDVTGRNRKFPGRFVPPGYYYEPVQPPIGRAKLLYRAYRYPLAGTESHPPYFRHDEASFVEHRTLLEALFLRIYSVGKKWFRLAGLPNAIPSRPRQ